MASIPFHWRRESLGAMPEPVEENLRNSESFLNTTGAQLVFRLPHLNGILYLVRSKQGQNEVHIAFGGYDFQVSFN